MKMLGICLGRRASTLSVTKFAKSQPRLGFFFVSFSLWCSGIRIQFWHLSENKRVEPTYSWHNFGKITAFWGWFSHSCDGYLHMFYGNFDDHIRFSPVQFSSVAQSCPTLCDLMNRSTPGLPVHHQLPEFTQTHVHRVCDAIQPSHPLSSPSPPAPNPSQHQSLFQWVNSLHEVSKVLELQL